MAKLIWRAHFLRGAIVSSYAQVEFLLTEFNVRCRQLPAYSEIAADFPYHLESKSARAKDLVGAPGPLRDYADELRALVDRISDYEDLRHFLAHGLIVLSVQETAHAPIIFRMYRKARKSPEEYGTIETDIDQLATVAHEIGEYARQMATLFEQIFRELSLEPGVPLDLNI